MAAAQSAWTAAAVLRAVAAGRLAWGRRVASWRCCCGARRKTLNGASREASRRSRRRRRWQRQHRR
eukprot:1828038-Prymnesium_polylepis.1